MTSHHKIVRFVVGDQHGEYHGSQHVHAFFNVQDRTWLMYAGEWAWPSLEAFLSSCRNSERPEIMDAVQLALETQTRLAGAVAGREQEERDVLIKGFDISKRWLDPNTTLPDDYGEETASDWITTLSLCYAVMCAELFDPVFIARALCAWCVEASMRRDPQLTLQQAQDREQPRTVDEARAHSLRCRENPLVRQRAGLLLALERLHAAAAVREAAPPTCDHAELEAALKGAELWLSRQGQDLMGVIDELAAAGSKLGPDPSADQIRRRLDLTARAQEVALEISAPARRAGHQMGLADLREAYVRGAADATDGVIPVGRAPRPEDHECVHAFLSAARAGTAHAPILDEAMIMTEVKAGGAMIAGPQYGELAAPVDNGLIMLPVQSPPPQVRLSVPMSPDAHAAWQLVDQLFARQGELREAWDRIPDGGQVPAGVGDWLQPLINAVTAAIEPVGSPAWAQAEQHRREAMTRVLYVLDRRAEYELGRPGNEDRDALLGAIVDAARGTPP